MSWNPVAWLRHRRSVASASFQGSTLVREKNHRKVHKLRIDEFETRELLSTYYVATSGNDSNDGLSTSTPFATFAKALNVVNTGGTIYFREGSYGGVYDPSIPSHGGTSWSNPLTIASYPGESATLVPGSAVACFGLRSTSVGGGFSGGFSYVVFDRLTMDGQGIADPISALPFMKAKPGKFGGFLDELFFYHEGKE